MRIKVSQLEANPYRKMKSYPIDRAKVEALKISIKEKTFWDNLLVRKNGTKYQLAYGHHRWQALKELGIKEIDVPVRDIDDATMVQIMAEENLNWSTSPAVMTQTIMVAKEFLDGELAKYETWNQIRLQENLRTMLGIDNGQTFAKLKSGVGESTITKFLGGNWTIYKVREALRIINDEKLDKQAVEIIPTMKQAGVFRTSVKEHKIPKPTQRKIAKKIEKEDVGYRDIPDLVAEHSTVMKKRKPDLKPLPMLDDVIRETCRLMNTLHTNLGQVAPHLDSIESQRLRKTFMRDGKELTDLMLGVFKNEKEKKK